MSGGTGIVDARMARRVIETFCILMNDRSQGIVEDIGHLSGTHVCNSGITEIVMFDAVRQSLRSLDLRGNP